ncbi:MAG TPA: PIN domain-containing protein [Opitutaceae bacterium]|nr:PIN domain-containing protein [Opitutaceae bacterium]
MPVSHYTFIDFENVPTVDLSLVEGHPVHVTLLIGARQKKLELALVQLIHRLGDQLELVEVGASGPNALDLTLACYLGRAIERAPDATFSIISRDRDFDPMIGHLRRNGLSIERHADIHVRKPVSAHAPARRSSHAAPSTAHRASPAAPRSAAAPKPESRSDDRAARITARLQNVSNRSRPTRRRGLLAQIKSSLGKGATEADAAALVRQLESAGVLSIDAQDHVSYPSR